METMNSGGNWLRRLAVVILIAAAPMAYAQATWTDPQTKLMWTKESNSTDVNWNQAKDYCANLTLGGYSNWRLPTIDELAGISDETQNVEGCFVKGGIIFHDYCRSWSNSQDNYPGWFWAINFYRNAFRNGHRPDDDSVKRALCVRSPGEAEHAQPSNADIASSQPAETGVAKTAGVPKSLMDFLSTGFQAICDKQKDTSSECVPNYMNSFTFRQVQYLSGQRPQDAVSGYLVEVNRNGCEPDAKCDVFYITPYIGTSTASADPENPSGALAGLAAIGSVEKAASGKSGWNAALWFTGNLNSVAQGNSFVQFSPWVLILGLKVNDREYRYDIASQRYYDIVAAQEAQQKLDENGANGEYTVKDAGFRAIFPCKPNIENKNGSTVYSCSLAAIEDPAGATTDLLVPRIGGSAPPVKTNVECKLVVSPRDKKPIPSQSQLGQSLESEHGRPNKILYTSTGESISGSGERVGAEINYLSGDLNQSPAVRHTIQREVVTPSRTYNGYISVLHRNGHPDPLGYIGPGHNLQDYPIITVMATE